MPFFEPSHRDPFFDSGLGPQQFLPARVGVESVNYCLKGDPRSDIRAKRSERVNLRQPRYEGQRQDGKDERRNASLGA